VHDSTGAQATVAPAVDLALVVLACGYADARRVGTAGELTDAVASARSGPAFVHVRTQPRADRRLPRPRETPAQVAARFQEWMRAHP
jgi:phosphonopyruvate decarboxylase